MTLEQIIVLILKDGGPLGVSVAMVILFLRNLDSLRTKQADERKMMWDNFAAERQSFLNSFANLGAELRASLREIGTDVKAAGKAHAESAEKVCESLNTMCQTASIAHTVHQDKGRRQGN